VPVFLSLKAFIWFHMNNLQHHTCFQDDPEIPFTEDDYRRRKPHPNFKEHISAEKMVIKFGKTVGTM